MKETWLALKLTRRELRSGLKGFYVFLLCLILGVGAIASVRSLSTGLMKTIEADGQYILGGDIALRTIYKPAPKEQIDFLNKKIGLTTVVAETRAMARSKKNDKANLVELKAIDVFYPLYGTFDYTNEDGELIKADLNVSAPLLPPGTTENGDYEGDWGAFVEPEIMEILDLAMGEKLTVGKQDFVIRGIIQKEPDRLGGERFTYAPRVMISRSSFDRTGLLQEGSQIYYDHKVILREEQRYEKLAEVQQRIADEFPDATWKGRNYFNASPVIERFIERLTLFLTLVGLTSLLVGGVGIGNAVRSYLESKYSNIATFKCLGASRKLVFKVYFYQIMIVGLIGTIIGCALGGIMPPLVAPLLTEKLSLSSNHVSVYPSELIIAGIFGLLTTACFSLFPIGKACEVKAADLFRSLIVVTKKWPSINVLIGLIIVLQALAIVVILTASDQSLATAFIVGTIGTIIIFMLVSNGLKTVLKLFRHIKTPSLRFAISNLYRPGNVTNGLILSLGLGLTVFVTIGLIEYNFSQKLRDNINENTPSFFLLDIQKDQVEDFKSLIASTETSRDLKLTPQLRGRITMVNGTPAAEALINEEDDWVLRGDRGFTYTDTLPDNSEITAGEWWDKDYNGTPIVSISQDVANAFEMGVDDTLTVNILGFDITARVANVREIDWGSFSMNFAVTFAPGPLNGAPATFLSTVKVDEDREMALQSEIAKNFPNVSAIRVSDALNTVNKILSGVAAAVRYSAGVTLIAGIMVLAGAIAASQKSRIYNAVVFKVMGVRRRQMMGVFLTEFFILGLISAVAAALIGTLCAWAILTKIMDIGFKFDSFTVLAVTLAALLLSTAFGIAATWRILGIKPAPYLRNE